MLKVALTIKRGEMDIIDLIGTIEDAHNMDDFIKLYSDAKAGHNNGLLVIKDPVYVNTLTVETQQGPRRLKLMDGAPSNLKYLPVDQVLDFGDLAPRMSRKYDGSVNVSRRDDAGIDAAKTEQKAEIPTV